MCHWWNKQNFLHFYRQLNLFILHEAVFFQETKKQQIIYIANVIVKKKQKLKFYPKYLNFNTTWIVLQMEWNTLVVLLLIVILRNYF